MSGRPRFDIVTVRDQIRTVADRWASQYEGNTAKLDFDPVAIGVKLAALDPETATEAEVDAIIGQPKRDWGGWCSLNCVVCKKRAEALAIIVDDEDCESVAPQVCARCLRAWVATLDRAHR